MSKHAYLIIAHNNSYILNRLLSLIDDERNDIFLHIDKKVEQESLLKECDYPKRSRLFLCNKRVDVKWGHISLVEIEFLLFEAAAQKRKYRYFHLISGVDLPIKTQNYIHHFFEENDGTEFVGFDNRPQKYRLTDRINKIHIATAHFKDSKYKRKVWFFLDFVFVMVQKIFRYNYGLDPKKNQLKKGCNWVSVTNDFVNYLLPQKEEMLKLYKYSVCPDEMFLHTAIFNSPFKEKINQEADEYKACVRCIDWERGHPYIFKKNDFDELKNSDRLFARKFDQSNLEIVDQIYNYLTPKEKP